MHWSYCRLALSYWYDSSSKVTTSVWSIHWYCGVYIQSSIRDDIGTEVHIILWYFDNYWLVKIATCLIAGILWETWVNLSMQKLKYSVPLLLMPMLLVSPCHQQPWYWLCSASVFFEDFNHVHYRTVRNYWKFKYIFILFKINSAQQGLINQPWSHGHSWLDGSEGNH